MNPGAPVSLDGTPPPPPPKKPFPWLYVLVGCGGCAVVSIPVIGIVAAIALPAFVLARERANEARIHISLKEICVAEERFRLEDCDGNGEPDYWTADLSALAEGVFNKAKGPPGLISAELACADAKYNRLPAGLKKARNGYWFQAIPRDERGKSFQTIPGRNPSRFAFCAWPENYRSLGRHTFIVGETGQIWRIDNGGKFVEQWPADPRTEGWEPAR